MTVKTTSSPIRRTSAAFIRIMAAGSLAAGIAVAAFAAPAQAGDDSDGTRVTVTDPDGTRVTGENPDGTRVTGDDTDGTRVTGDRDLQTDPDGTRVTSRDWS
ncbi:hypothetical protein K3N28_21345 [Glycomyces sp. TRM65418]|uniref:hypothetical protein n=1 Tax=Glycomyces sp. TRM65418 TaxID=2867006 RepID=UPI001CE5137F|nr:hypothetical protein [Glycomyces sp. TRM65418]MCC3765608.1 hypothetical protein [Glycomyces sp. TRM65418]QZD55209.1 hypothetical protein K3N28_21235 [Glycomyces sp. TRM65418]